MACSGLPTRNGNAHVAEIASLSLALKRRCDTLDFDTGNEKRIEMRFGINTGPVTAGLPIDTEIKHSKIFNKS